MFSRRAVLALSISASLIFLIWRPSVGSDWPVIFKVLSIGALAYLGFRVSALFGAALSISAAGDFLLGVSHFGRLGSEKLFLFGLCAFLITHLLYIAVFRHYPVKRTPLRVLGILAILTALGGMFWFLHDSLGSMLIPVTAYSLVIAAMGISAMLAELRSPLAAIGALLFIVSDDMIALGRFHSAVPAENYLIWITYYAAQLFIEEAVSGR